MPRIDMSGAGTKSWTYTDPKAGTWPHYGKTADTPTATKAFIVHRPNGYSIIAPYNAAFVEMLKCLIPANARKWEPASKSWFIVAGRLADIEGLLGAYYTETEWVYAETMRQQAPPPQPAPRPAQPQHLPPTEANMRLYHADAATLEVWPTASLEVVRAAYRAKAKKLHPDVSGRDTTAEMKVLNAAMAAFESRHGAKK